MLLASFAFSVYKIARKSFSCLFRALLQYLCRVSSASQDKNDSDENINKETGTDNNTEYTNPNIEQEKSTDTNEDNESESNSSVSVPSLFEKTILFE